MLHTPLSNPQEPPHPVEQKPWVGNLPTLLYHRFSLPPTQGTDIITLLNTVHYDPTQFLKPQEFNPEHFLDASQSFKKSPAFMPFSAGESGGDKSQSFRPVTLTYIALILLSKPSHFFIPPILSFGCAETSILPSNSAPTGR